MIEEKEWKKKELINNKNSDLAQLRVKSLFFICVLSFSSAILGALHRIPF